MNKDKGTTRRGFLKGTVMAGAGALAMTGSSVFAQGAPVSAENVEFAYETEVLIGGAGMSGMAAALAATEEGAEVIILEAASETGGTALFSGGAIHIWGAKTFEDLQNRVPLVDPTLGTVFVDNWADTIEWLAGYDAGWPEVSAALAAVLGDNWLSLGGTYEEKRATFDALNGFIEDQGGTIMTQTRVIDIIADASGRVVGLVVMDADGQVMNIKATKAVILATGAFSANPEMRVRYLGINADLANTRASLFNKGDALILGGKVGARLSRSFGTFYGHLQAYPPLYPQTEQEYDEFDKELLRQLQGAVQGYEPRSILVNLSGDRFVDEALGDDIANQAVIHQELARAFLLVDSETVGATANIDLLLDNGGVVLEAETVEDLVTMVGEYGVNTTHLMNTINAYNDAAENETGMELTPSRGGTLTPFATAPFYAIQVTTGISGPYGGLMVNEGSQVLNLGMVPIPGLYATPHASGGVFYRDYGGSLGLCTCFGRIAGMNAAAETGE